ncbi:hypothetical protein PAPYR_11820 [Paratrimastix pyriformis]|uniref:Uncharacterized protein n=1 Tax=Paratrimastix pyriformis TaxID=342808 RepID=A0ABQ8U5E8_9EUKA|nr:hypothetical protein PAPYR_11820 [Paratrimastix pyriformis]
MDFSTDSTWDDEHHLEKIRFLLKIHTAGMDFSTPDKHRATLDLRIPARHLVPHAHRRRGDWSLEADSSEEPRGHSRCRANPSSAADAAPASSLRLDTVTAMQPRHRTGARNPTMQERGDPTCTSQSPPHSSSQPSILPAANMRGRALPEPPTAEPEETPEPEQTTVPEQTTEPVPEQTTIEPLETTTTEPEVTTSDPVQATTTEPAEPSEPEPAQSELQQTGTEPEAAEQSVPGEPEQLAEPEQPAEPELTPNPSRPQPLLRRPQSSPPNAVVACPSSETEGGLPGYQEVRSRSPDIDPGNPAFTAAAGCWFNRCSQDASASGIRAFQNPTCSPCVLRLTCSPGHRHEHYCHASSSGSGSGFRASQNPTCSFGHRHEHDCHASSSGSGSGFRASQNPTCSPGHRHEHDCKASSSGSGSSFRASQNAPHRHEFHLLASWFPSTNHLNRGLIVPVHFFETMAEYRLSGAICVELHKVLNRLGHLRENPVFDDLRSKTYQFLTSRALMILVCLDSEAAFGVDRAVDGHMRLEELALWERTFPFYVKEVFHDRSMLELTDYYGEQFPKVFQACEREYLALSEDEWKTYDWSIQCHKFRTNTCYREIPAHWDCLFKFTGSA